jgi:quinol monooxygenase YgiN
MPGVCVIVAYRPKPGKEDGLLELVRSRVPTLHQEGLVSDRAPTIMRARDGTIIEVSEWKWREAIDAAHKNPNVLAMWQKFFRRVRLCSAEYVGGSSGNVRRFRANRFVDVE